MQKQRLGRQRRELSAAARPEPEPEAEAAVGGSSSSSSSSGQLLEQQIMELTVEADGRSGEQKPGTPTTPRSKHSATEQRRRCKINERFQILRDLIPHIDQKRDRATFLLEVIEYVKFLQEKVQKNEACNEWNQENAKLMPWSNNRVPVDGMPDTAHASRNGPVPGQTLSGKFVDNSIPAAPAMLHNTQNAAESADINTDSLASQSQSQWQQFSCPADCTISNDTSDEHEELAIDEGTITVSSVYSQNLFTALTHAMESLGVDLSQASVTVQVNLGKRAICRRPNTVSCSKGQDDSLPANQTMEDSGQTRSCDDSEQASKRHKINRS